MGVCVCVFNFMHGEEALPSFCDACIMAIKSLESFIFLSCDHYSSNLLFRVLLIDFYK